MSVAFLSPSLCSPDALSSPLARALVEVSPELVRDLSLDGKIEVRGEVDRLLPATGEELIRLSPRRGLLLVEEDPLAAAERLRADGFLAYDVSGALAGLAVRGERVLRRLTDLDLERLPAAGAVAKIGAVVVRDPDDWFRVYFSQELGHYVAEVVLDALEGLRTTGVGPKPVPGHGAG